MIHTGEISSKIAKIVLEEMFTTGGDPSQIITDKGLVLMSDPDALEEIAKNRVGKRDSSG